jgi:hypothetical protein
VTPDRWHDFGPLETTTRPAGFYAFDDGVSPAQHRSAVTMGEVQAFLSARLLRLNPMRRVATVALKRVGRGRSYSGAYSGATEQLAPVTDLRTSRQIGRLVKVNPTATGAELDLIVGDEDAWHSLAAGTARIDALVAFTGSSGGDPVNGRPLRIEIG